jgi:hypothetical protein
MRRQTERSLSEAIAMAELFDVPANDEVAEHRRADA